MVAANCVQFESCTNLRAGAMTIVNKNGCHEMSQPVRVMSSTLLAMNVFGAALHAWQLVCGCLALMKLFSIVLSCAMIS
jgi:hypothetical protein